MNFDNLDLLPVLRKNIDAAGYTTPTPIQVQAIPAALRGVDILGTARTGTGKTAAFTLPLLQRLDAWAGDDPVLRALILTPTRELAAQIGESLTVYGRGMDLDHAVVFGGVNIQPQIRALRDGVDVLVATPGRLLDLLGQKALTLEHVGILVLDEADRMLDMGFLPDVRKIVRHIPARRQTLLFSATMPPEIRRIADDLLHTPEIVSVHPTSSPAEAVSQHLYFVDRGDKKGLLVELLKGDATMRTLVFTRTKHGANRLTRQLADARVHAAAIHGNKSQGARTRALEGFREGSLRVLVATDVAARGIDVDGVTHVINYDLPNVPETYVHRIGRTGRAGRSGIALSFCDVEERPHLAAIERLIGRSVPRVDDHRYPSREPSSSTSVSRGTPGASASRGARPSERARDPGGRKRRPARRGFGGSAQTPRRGSATGGGRS